MIKVNANLKRNEKKPKSIQNIYYIWSFLERIGHFLQNEIRVLTTNYDIY